MRGKYRVCILICFFWVASVLSVRSQQVEVGAKNSQSSLPSFIPSPDESANQMFVPATVPSGNPTLLDPTRLAPEPAVVPEPGTIAMLVLGGALSSVLAVRRSRRG